MHKSADFMIFVKNIYKFSRKQQEKAPRLGRFPLSAASPRLSAMRLSATRLSAAEPRLSAFGG